MLRGLQFHVGTVLFALLPAHANEAAFAEPSQAERVTLRRDASSVGLYASGHGRFHVTQREVTRLRTLSLPDGDGFVALWSEVDSRGASFPFYAISKGGQRVDVAREARHEILLRNREFAPAESSTRIESEDGTKEQVYIVQFVTQPLEEYRALLRGLGARVERFLAHQCHLVRMSADVAMHAAELPFVRFVGEYRVQDRLESALWEGLEDDSLVAGQRYVVQVFERGLAEKLRVSEVILQGGGTVEPLYPEGYFLRATMPPGVLTRVARMKEVLWIDRQNEAIPAMDIARMLGGANNVESRLGFTGAGVRGEVLDFGVRLTHQEFQARPLILHGTVPLDSHGTATTSEVFATGIDPLARGMLPDGQGIAAYVFNVTNPYVHRQELVDPSGPYRAVFQSNSWGWLPLSSDYTNRTTEIDDAIFQTDLLLTWGQGNSGDQVGLQEPWAKNLIAVGGFLHGNTLTIQDDTWSSTGSIGPARDGRIKPDLTAFYDNIYVAGHQDDQGYSPTFGGTSGATPIVAGHCGLFFEMWHEGVFGNDPTGSTVFESRPHSTTAKAVMINTATPFEFSGLNHDFARVHQGWGRPDLTRLYQRRKRMLIINESDVLENLESTLYEVRVSDANESLRATLCYLDVAGTTSSTQHRVNDLTLRVTDPSGNIYWGNNGLMDGTESVSGGAPNTVDTVENVFIESPELGLWRVEVIASEINADTHLETPEIDADYALVVSGIDCAGPQIYCTAAPGLMCGEPSVSASGIPSASASSGYVLSAGPARGQTPGILFYGRTGPLSIPFQGGTLCVRPPHFRSVLLNSGGTQGNCDGQFTIDRNAFARGLLGGHPASFLSTPGTTVHSQFWGRDSSAGGSFLSDAVVDVICD